MTEKQKEMIWLLCSGKSEKEIARQYNKSLSAVKAMKLKIREITGIPTTQKLLARFVDMSKVEEFLND